VSIPQAVLQDAKQAIAGQSQLASQAQWLEIAVKTIRSLLLEIGEPAPFEIDPEVRELIAHGVGSDQNGSGRDGHDWFLREGQDVYDYDEEVGGAHGERRSRPKGKSKLHPHELVFRTLGRY